MNQAGERAAGLANEGDDHRATSNCNSQGEKVISFDADRFLPNGEAHRLSASLSNALVAESPNRLMNHTDILLHALLEERCLNESTVRARKWAITAVQVEAQARYQHLTTQLASLGILSSTLSGESHATTRQRYRDGLDVLSRPRLDVPAAGASRRALKGRNTNSTESGSIDLSQAGSSSVAANSFARFGALENPLQYHRQILPLSLQKLRLGAGSDITNALALPSTENGPFPRYELEFEEVARLGSGGFGTVYQARHRIDNQHYAIKKIPLSTKRLARLQQRGSVELEELLREVRVLATLDHPNIVRYFGGWIEWSDGSSRKGRESPSTTGISSNDALTCSAATETPSLRIARTDDDLVASSIVFEEDSAPLSNGDALAGASINNAGSADSGSTESLTENHFSTSVPFSELLHQSLQTSHTPSLALHIQMSLHPMTIAEYLAPAPILSDPAASSFTTGKQKESNIFRPSHCYHLHPSLNILHALLDGLEYLHEQGIVHRDIKPSNIFLGWKKRTPSRGSRGGTSYTREVEASRGSTSCQDCVLSASEPLALKSDFDARVDVKMEMEMEVRIGDFGVAGFERAELGFLPSSGDYSLNQEQQSEELGTALYRPVPPPSPAACAALTATWVDTNSKGIKPSVHPGSYTTPSESRHSKDKAVGNLIPDHIPTASVSVLPSPALKPNKDIYALALITLELLTPFCTRAERIHVLQNLKSQASFPLDFGCGIRDPEVKRRLKGMVGEMLWGGLDVMGVRLRLGKMEEIMDPSG